jgi:diguanylate cyclase (GGDEF)-like protein
MWVGAVAALGLSVGAGWLLLGRSRQAAAPRADNAPAPSEGIDTVTGLPSRGAFDERAVAVIEAAEAQGRTGCALYVGLDGFRIVNDRHGRATGDAVLRAVGALLQDAAGADTLVCRVTGDEFALWLDMPLEPARRVADRIVATLGQTLVVAGQPHTLRASLGIAVLPDHGTRLRIMARAAAAMRAVKRAGGNAHTVFSPPMAVSQREQADLLCDLRQAPQRREIELHYQPQVDSASRRATTAEALLRWRHPTRGLVSAASVIALAERHGLIGSIGDWVVDTALDQAAQWRKLGLSSLRVAINLSGFQLRDDAFAARLGSRLRELSLPADCIACEVTQSVAMEDTPVTRSALERLHTLGLQLVVTDVEGDPSDLALLRSLPCSAWKMSPAIVNALSLDPGAQAAAQAIVRCGHELGLRVTATGIETEAQRDMALALGCDELQGHLFARPMRARALALWAADASATLSAAFGTSQFKPTQPLSTQTMMS